MREMSGPSEPVRLREESASALERALLDAGRSYRSSGTARTKTLAALGVAGSATLLAGTAQALPLATLAKMTWGKLIAAISIVGATAAVPVGYFAWQRHHQPAKHGGAAPALVAAPAQIPAASPARVLEAPAIAQPTAPASETGSAVSARSARPAVTLAHELSSLDAARGLLARGDARGAWRGSTPTGTPTPTAGSGWKPRCCASTPSTKVDTATLRARAEAFLQHHPHSVLAARVRTRLGD